MFKLTTTCNTDSAIIPMSKMKPCQIGEIVSGDHDVGHVVMRTASIGTFEVMDLTAPGEGECWGGVYSGGVYSGIKVKLLPKGTRITLEVV